MDTIEMLITDESMDGVYAVSLVDLPAIEENFLLLHKDSKRSNFTLATITKDTEDQHIITGPALIPDKEIYRVNPITQEEYNIVFKKKTIQKCAELFFKRKQNDQVTLDHDIDVDGVTFFESWIITDSEKDKAFSLGYNLPVGTWMLSAKIYDDKLWSSIKNGKYKGFSIEAYFAEKLSIQNSFNEEIVLTNLISQLETDEFNEENFIDTLQKI